MFEVDLYKLELIIYLFEVEYVSVNIGSVLGQVILRFFFKQLGLNYGTLQHIFQLNDASFSVRLRLKFFHQQAILEVKVY
jgi:hypothetical protein